jgi:DNA-binding Lrp family transcriptional regulator
MARARDVQAFKDESQDLEARIVSAIGLVGPRNIALISRMTGAHQETVRYKIKRRFVEKGFRFHANVDYRKLGLTLHWVNFVVPPVHYRSATKFFRFLNSGAYLIHFSKILPQGHFVALFSLPEGKTDEFVRFLENLKQRKIIAEFSLDRVLAQRHKMMDPSFFNFKEDGWGVDWQKMRSLRASPLIAEKRRTEILADNIDMIIIKELQKDARQHIVGIARKLRLNAKTLEYHYRTHVMGEGLIPNFSVRWMKDPDEPLARSTILLRLTFRDLEGKQYETIQSVINKLPFLWVEDLLELGTYIATLSVPLENLAATMNYINEELQYLGRKIEVGYLRVDESWTYTIPYHMFSDGKWRFNVKKMETATLREISARPEK